MKKAVIMLLVVGLLAGVGGFTPVRAAEAVIVQITVGSTIAHINSTTVVLDQPPIIENGRTLVPFRFIGEAIGATIGWNPVKKTVSYVLRDKNITLTIGSITAMVNGVKTTLDVAPKILPTGRTVVPVRFITESVGAKVDWNATTRMVTVTVPATTVVKIAAIFPGSIQDADYNTLGYTSLQAAAKSVQAASAYSAQVAVPDSEAAMGQYIAAGYNVIFVHGNQFNTAALKLADAYPNVSFIIEVDGKADLPKPNVWYVSRNYFPGMYVLGRLAALTTKTGKIGFVGGLNLPFLTGDINIIKQAIRDSGLNVSLDYLFVGDFNDPVKAKQGTESLIARGDDVIIPVLNNGIYGAFAAVSEATKKVYITSLYTDKLTLAPENFLTSDLFDFTPILKGILAKIVTGTKGGYVEMEFGEGKPRYTQFPVRNVSQDVNGKVKQIAEDVVAGKIHLQINLAAILP